MRIPRSLVGVAVAALALAVMPVAASASASASPVSAHHGSAAAAKPHAIRPLGTVSSTVAGYQAVGSPNQYNQVSATWVQPWVNCDPNYTYATWVGLDGATASDPTPEQIGVEVDCSGTSSVYNAFYQLPGGAKVKFANVLPDDEIGASINVVSAGKYSLSLADYTHGWTKNYVLTASGTPLNETAEVLVGMELGSPYPLADYGYQGISGFEIKENTDPSAEGAQSVTLDNVGKGYGYPSPITVNGSFGIGDQGGQPGPTGSPLVAYQGVYPTNQLVYTWTPQDPGQDMGTTILRNTSPSIAVLPDGGFEEAVMTAYKTIVVIGTDYTYNTELGVAGGGSPTLAVSPVPGGSFEIAFEASNGTLWTYTPSTGGTGMPLPMVGSSTPSIAALPGGGYEIAYVASNGQMKEIGAAGSYDSGNTLVRGGTNPEIAAAPGGGFETVFEDEAGYLVTATAAGLTPTSNQMAGATNPSIAALTGGGYAYTYIDTALKVHVVSAGGNQNLELAALTNTAPSITAVGNSFWAAFEDTNGYLDLFEAGYTYREPNVRMAGTSTYPSITN